MFADMDKGGGNKIPGMGILSWEAGTVGGRNRGKPEPWVCSSWAWAWEAGAVCSQFEPSASAEPRGGIRTVARLLPDYMLPGK